MATCYMHRYQAARLLLTVLVLSLWTVCSGQYAPAAGLSGSTAIPASADSIVMWADGCTIVRGLQDIAIATSGYATAGDSSQAIGPAGGNTIVSLGDGGIATLSFSHAIIDGPGFDFAVFENGFSPAVPEQAFLELGFVEVSSDGQRFVRFPAVDDTQDSIQIGNGGTMNAARLNNLAGKYISGYGTPFDLSELRDSVGLDINHILYVRIRDVVGTLSDSYATRDSRGHKINDPYPTPFASCGFDLDAVGVMHAEGLTGIADVPVSSIQVYPNPVASCLYVQTYTPYESAFLSLYSIAGEELQFSSFSGAATVDMSKYPAGVYEVTVTSASRHSTHLIIKQ